MVRNVWPMVIQEANAYHTKRHRRERKRLNSDSHHEFNGLQVKAKSVRFA